MKASDVAVLIPAACKEVLNAMYFTDVLAETPQEDTHEGVPSIVQSYAFALKFSGDVSGRFGLCLEHGTARRLAANFLGEDETDIAEGDVIEVVGELTNMFCGSAVSQIESGTKFVLSHPQPVQQLPAASSEDLIFVGMETDSGPITTWVVVDKAGAHREN
jgi:CheY-specific phosphatase CheX